MSANIILSNPPDYDLQGLAETTRQSLALLKPWTLLDTSKDPLAAQIVAQAGKYVAAIQLGVSAAYSGFTVTEEVLFLANALPIDDKDDLQHYLVGMMELAKEARENANTAHQAFRNVRREIFATMDDLKAQKYAFKGLDTDGPRRLPDHRSEDIDVLVKFSENISKFADWWDWVKVETDPSPAKCQPISFQIDALREPGVVNRWNHLRTQYTTYVQMISEMEDADPAFFNRASSPDISRINGSTLIAGSIESSSTSLTATIPGLNASTSVSPANWESRATSVSLLKASIGNREHVVISENEKIPAEPKSLTKKFLDSMSLSKLPKCVVKHVKKLLGGRQKSTDKENPVNDLYKAGWTTRWKGKGARKSSLDEGKASHEHRKSSVEESPTPTRIGQAIAASSPTSVLGIGMSRSPAKAN